MEIKKKFSSGMILIDIEGEEYNLLNQKAFIFIKNFHIIIEMHPFLVENGFSKNQKLIRYTTKF